MNGGAFTGLTRPESADARERVDAENRASREQVERWAVALGAELRPVLPLPVASEPPCGWRASAGDLTPGAAPAPKVAGAAATGPAASQTEQGRLVVQVDGGDLGEVALVVDRSQGAIQVTIGVSDSVAEARVTAEKLTLLQALESTGIQVQSVSVARLSSFGTVLAPRRGSAVHPGQSQGSDEDEGREHRRTTRKLNVIG